MVKEYIKATVQVENRVYRVYCHHGARINIGELYNFFEKEYLPQIINVESADELDLDDRLEIIMIDETGIYFW